MPNLQRNESLKMWRAVLCIAVLLVHLGLRISEEDKLLTFTDFGKDGVYAILYMLFIISGYLACCSKELRQGNTLIYWYKRATRILPLYYFVIVFYYITETYIFKTAPTDIDGLGWKRYFLLIFGFIRSDERFWNNIGFTWTIPVFLIFYLIAPIVVKFVKNYRQSWVAVILFTGISCLIDKYGAGNFHACAYLHYFMGGVMFYYCEKEKKEEETIFIISVLLIGFMALFTPERVGIDYYGSIFALITILLLISTRKLKIRNRYLQKIVDELDKYSFTIYLAQGMVIEEILRKCRPLPSWIDFVIGFISTGIVAFIIYNFFENPIHNALLSALNGFLERKQENR